MPVPRVADPDAAPRQVLELKGPQLLERCLVLQQLDRPVLDSGPERGVDVGLALVRERPLLVGQVLPLERVLERLGPELVAQDRVDAVCPGPG